MKNSNPHDDWNAAIDCLDRIKKSKTKCQSKILKELNCASAYFESARSFYKKKEHIKAFQDQFLYILDRRMELFFEEIDTSQTFDRFVCLDFNQNCRQELERILALSQRLNASELKGNIFYNLGLGYYKLIDVFKETDDELLSSLVNFAKDSFQEAARYYHHAEHIQICQQMIACIDFDVANLLLIVLKENENPILFQKFFDHLKGALAFYVVKKDWCLAEDMQALIDFTSTLFNQYDLNSLVLPRYEFKQLLSRMGYEVEIPRHETKHRSFFQSGESLCNLEKKPEDIQIPSIPSWLSSFDLNQPFWSRI